MGKRIQGFSCNTGLNIKLYGMLVIFQVTITTSTLRGSMRIYLIKLMIFLSVKGEYQVTLYMPDEEFL